MQHHNRQRGAGRARALGFFLALAASAGWAAIPVEESQPLRDAGAASGDGTRLSGLFYQIQILQQEIQELRGIVEEQAHVIEQLREDQKAQYINLDGRILALAGGEVSASAAPGAAAGTGRTEVPEASGSAVTDAPTAAGAPAGDAQRAAYADAFSLMKAEQFDEAIRGFNRYIVDYPGGEFTPNAFYWLGQLYSAKGDNEKARQSLAQVVDLYPAHPKVADALYKLGVVYHQLGDSHKAIEYLNRVRAQYPRSEAARLAEQFASEMR